MTASALRVFREEGPPRSEEPQFFGKTPVESLDDPNLVGSDVRVLSVLSYLARHSFPRVDALRSDIARRSKLAERALRACLDRLERFKYLRRERDYGKPGAPHVIILTIEFRAPFQLENDVHATGKKRACNRRSSAACNRRSSAACNRRSSAGSMQFASSLRGFNTERETERGGRDAPPLPPPRVRRQQEFAARWKELQAQGYNPVADYPEEEAPDAH